MAQFPLALSIEPRLLPLAIADGFRMDSRVRIYHLLVIDITSNGYWFSTAILCSVESSCEPKKMERKTFS
jgi:hypothetical protein